MMSEENKNLEALAEQWVNLVFAHIEANKQKTNLSKIKKEEKDEQKLHTIPISR